jgi:hypothetical protein
MLVYQRVPSKKLGRIPCPSFFEEAHFGMEKLTKEYYDLSMLIYWRLPISELQPTPQVQRR